MNRILLKIGRAPITNVISDTYRTVRVKPYWELTHQANPISIVHRGSLHLQLPAIDGLAVNFFMELSSSFRDSNHPLVNVCILMYGGHVTWSHM
jgi:hypothetical protein